MRISSVNWSQVLVHFFPFMLQGGYIPYLIGIDLEMCSVTMLPTGTVLSQIWSQRNTKCAPKHTNINSINFS